MADFRKTKPSKNFDDRTRDTDTDKFITGLFNSLNPVYAARNIRSSLIKNGVISPRERRISPLTFQNQPSTNFEDRTDAHAAKTYGYLNDAIGTYLLRKTGMIPDPEDVANLPRRDNINIREGLKSHMEAMFEKANRYYGPTPFQPNPGPVGRAAMDHQLTDPRQNIPLEDFVKTANDIFRQVNPPTHRIKKTKEFKKK